MAGKRPAGARYPHATTDARDADHRFCAVLARVAERVAAGKEPWGTLHVIGRPLSEAGALDAQRGLYRARNHSGRTCGADPLSVKVTRTAGSNGTWTISFQVWSRRAAKKHIVERVRRGETLPYNVLRR